MGMWFAIESSILFSKISKRVYASTCKGKFGGLTHSLSKRYFVKACAGELWFPTHLSSSCCFFRKDASGIHLPYALIVELLHNLQKLHPGILVPDTNRRIVKFPEEGMLKKIMVPDTLFGNPVRGPKSPN